MPEKPLISVVVLCYKNYNLIMDALYSILNQDYPNIELIISNDCSGDFKTDELQDFFKEYKTKYPNIKNVIINQNPKNTGTTKHVNSMVKRSSGKYFKLLAADDLFFDNSALTKYVDFLERSGAYFVVARSAAFDEKLEHFLRYYPCDEHAHILKTFSAEDQFAELAKDCIINAPAVCFSRKYIDDFGYFDERYFYADDWPAWLQFTRGGHRIEFMDEVLVIYRFGGISNNNKNNEAIVATKVLDEYFDIMKNESVQHFKDLSLENWLRCRKLIMDYHAGCSHGFHKFTIYISNFDLYLMSRAQILHKDQYARFVLMFIFIAVITVFGNIYLFEKLQQPFLQFCADFIASVAILGTLLLSVLYLAVFLYDFFLKKK